MTVVCFSIAHNLLSTVQRGKRNWRPYYAYLKGFLLYFGEVCTTVHMYMYNYYCALVVSATGRASVRGHQWSHNSVPLSGHGSLWLQQEELCAKSDYVWLALLPPTSQVSGAHQGAWPGFWEGCAIIYERGWSFSRWTQTFCYHTSYLWPKIERGCLSTMSPPPWLRPCTYCIAWNFRGA